MAVCYDTSVLLAIVRDDPERERVRVLVNPEREIEYISYVTYAELLSMAYRNNWGVLRRNRLEQVIRQLNIVQIQNPVLTGLYVEIEAFSQRKHHTIASAFTARNMGKHDIWIASTASMLGLRLLTTDPDFDHLAKTFVDLDKRKPQDLLS